MIDHPIPPVTEPLQYRAIGVVRGTYHTNDKEKFTRGYLVDEQGEQVEAVVLGRVITLIRRHLNIDEPHLWVVYPRCRESDHLHLQISGIWEPSTLAKRKQDGNLKSADTINLDYLPEGDDYFSIRGELIYTRPETNDLVVRIRQKPRSKLIKPQPFKILIKGEISLEYLRKFVSLDVRRKGQNLVLEKYEILGAVPSKSSKKGGKSNSRVIKKSD